MIVLHDISHRKIEPTNIVVLQDNQTGEHYHIKVKDVIQETDSTRKIIGDSIRKGDRGVPESVPFEFKLVMGVPQLGRVIESVELDTMLDAGRSKGDIENMIVYEAQKTLSTRITSGYGMPVKELVLYLQNLGLLPKDYDAAKKFLLNLRRRHKDMFESKGGRIFLIPENKRKISSDTMQSPYKRTRVDFNKFTLGCRLLLESGVFGEVEFYNL